MKKIIYCLIAGFFLLGITSCHDQHMRRHDKKGKFLPEKKKKKKPKYYRDTPEYKQEMREYKDCTDPNECPEKFERHERRW